MGDVESAAAARLDSIVEAFDGCESFLIQTHNNPDPDSIACAFALRYLVQRYTGHSAVIAFGGIVGRSENRAMVRELEIPLTPGSLLDYHAYDFTAVCDTQPGTNHTSFPEGFVHNARQGFYVAAGSDFGNHPSVGPVQVHLAEHDTGERFRSTAHHSRCGLIARCLNAKD